MSSLVEHMLGFDLRAVHEDIILPVVSMHINERKHSTSLAILFLQLPIVVLYQTLGVIDGWVKELARLLPPSELIDPQQRKPTVPQNNAIRIKHRHEFKHKLLPHFLRLGILRQ